MTDVTQNPFTERKLSMSTSYLFNGVLYVNGVTTNLFTYNGLDLVYETQNGTIIYKVIDNLSRPAGISLANLPYNIGYQYDAYGRFSSVTSSMHTANSMANYMRLSGSDLITGCAQGDLTRSVNYETNRDLIASIGSHFGAALISSFDYQNNAIGQRIQRIDNSSVTNTFGFNSRQEVINAIMGNDDYGYGYDSIGNRQWSSLNLATNLYTANNLNQYTTISVPQHEPQYDLDGSMVYDGSEWHYSWNGENRLVCASNDTHIVSYAYDHQGRMVWKRIVATGTPTETISYLWDDYNIISETIQNQQSTITNNYVWGLDLSGSLQGAGGVGGLLAVVNDNAEFLPCYDANGNVTEYITTSGTIVAHYEYSPFGENTAHSGSLVDAFTHRFSTKPWCPITNLNEYELRKYRPDIGSWISRDPIEEQGGANLYGFVINCPLSSYDLYGLAECSWAVGLCSRKVAGVTMPENITIKGKAFTIPNNIRNAVNLTIPNHHDVRVESYSSTDCTGTAVETITRGFFANNFTDAVSYYALSLLLSSSKYGWVNGYVGDSEIPGKCSMHCVTKARYDIVKSRIITSPASRYHLTRYNCQTWAAEQLR